MRRPAELVHAVTLLVGGALLVRANRRQWFFGDEWDFIARRSGTSLHDLFAPHNEHWSTLPILVYRGLIRTVGLDSYLPYVLVLVACHLALAALLRRLLVQSGSDGWIATVLVGAFVVLGSGFENLLWAFQIGFIGSVAAGVGVVLLVNHDGPADRRDLVAVVVATVALTLSGITVTMIAIAALCIWLRRGLVDAVRFAAVPTAVYVVWLLAIGREGLGSHPVTVDSIFLLPQYMWRGIGSGIDATLATTGAGLVLFVLLAAWLLRKNGFVATPGAAATATFVGVVVLFVVVGIGRAGLGTEQAQSSRYVYIEVALLLPAVARALTALAGSHPGRLAVVSGVAAVVAISNVGLLRSAAATEAAREGTIRGQVTAAADLVRSGRPTLAAEVEPTFSPDLRAPALPLLVDQGLPTGPYSPTDALAAAVHLQVAVRPGPPARPPSARLVDQVDATVSPTDTGCLRIEPSGPSPQVVLAVGEQPALLVLESPAAGNLSVTLRRGTPFAVGPSRSFPLVAGANVVEIVAPDTSPVLSVPAGGYVACGA